MHKGADQPIHVLDSQEQPHLAWHFDAELQPDVSEQLPDAKHMWETIRAGVAAVRCGRGLHTE
jgi:hypothetical protein